MEQLIVILVLIIIGYVFGRQAEARHYRSIREREQKFLPLPCTDTRWPLQPDRRVNRSEMVTGNVVVSVDYFKRLLAALRALVGGNVSAYETLLDRARREAILRMKESAYHADEIINLRVETSSVFQSAQGGTGSIEVHAYGTAIYYRNQTQGA